MYLSRPAYRYVHATLNRLVNGRGDCRGVLNRQELLYLYSMVRCQPIYLGNILVEYLHQEAQYAKVGVIFSRPYITKLIMGMGLLYAIQGAEKTIIPSPLGIQTT